MGEAMETGEDELGRIETGCFDYGVGVGSKWSETMRRDVGVSRVMVEMLYKLKTNKCGNKANVAGDTLRTGLRTECGTGRHIARLPGGH